MSTTKPENENGAVTTFSKQLVSNAEKKPGWVYLLVIAYVSVPFMNLPAFLPLFGRKISVPSEVWASLITLAAYTLGDALDKITFKSRVVKDNTWSWEQRFQPPAYEAAKQEAETTLGITGGVYDVSMKILEAADDARFSVHFVNEFAKCVRSLILPVAFVAIVTSWLSLTWVPALVLSVVTIVAARHMALVTYPRLKTSHITSLYTTVPKLAVLVNNKGILKLRIAEVDDARLFFWEDKFVAAGRIPDRPTKDDGVRDNDQANRMQAVPV